MAPRKNAKKKPEAPKVDIGAEIFASLRELEAIKGIPVEYMVERLKQALTNAYRKDREDRRDVPADNVVVDLNENGLSMHIIKTVVEELEDTALEIHIDAARNINPNVQLGDTLSIPVDIQKFGRIAAQTAKQVVIQGIREAERGVMFESYSNKAQELLTLNLIGYEYYTYPPKFKDDGSTIMYKWRKLYLNINLQKQNRGHFIRSKR